MSNDKHRHTFTLPGSKDRTHFIQFPEEYITGYYQIGEEVRFADGAFVSESAITVKVEDVPDFLDAVASYRELPKYTDLLATYDALQYVIDRLNSPIYSSGVSKGAILRELKMALKGETVE